MKVTKTTTSLLLALPALIALACGAENPSKPRSAELGKPFDLAPGETAVIAGERLRISFEAVTGDSRCATGATCVWEGDAAVRVTLIQDARDKATLELHTNGRFAREGTYLRFRVLLEGVAPYPKLDTAIEPKSYRATLKVEAAP